MQNPTTKRFSCLSLTRAQEAQRPMTNENKALQWAMLICLLSMAAGTLALVAFVGGAL